MAANNSPAGILMDMGGSDHPLFKNDEQRCAAHALFWTLWDRDGKERIANKVTVGNGQHP